MTQDQRTAFVKVVDEVRANDAILHHDWDMENRRKNEARAASEKRHKIGPLQAAIAAAEARLRDAKDAYNKVDRLVDNDVRSAEAEHERKKAATAQRYILARSEILSLDSAAEAHAIVQRLLGAK
jgi:hypothetical protein